jgi:aldose 1-epimerase
VETFTLANAHGLQVRATSYGGIIMSILAPDRHGRLADVVLGHDSVDGYRDNPRYLGAIIGRCANRIANAQFTIDGTIYRLAANIGRHHLHGGLLGFDKVVWKATPTSTRSVALDYTSPDGEEGYPGTLQVRVTYTVTDRNELIVDYEATTDRATPVNLTQHSYFNLAGEGDVLSHLIQINADAMTPVDETKIPTGAIAPVAGGRFDLRSLKPIGDSDFDHNFVLNRSGPGLVHAARVEERRSGRTLDVHTTEPGVQFYTGHTLGLCLETQHFPDAPNQPQFPSTILPAGATYRSKTLFVFGVTP